MQKKEESPLILLTICLLLKYILIFFSLIWNSMSINIQIVATLENSFEIPREIKHRITIWPNSSIYDMYSEKSTDLNTLKWLKW